MNAESSISRAIVDATLIDHDRLMDGVSIGSIVSVSPRGTHYWKPSCCIDKKPFIGQLFQSVDDGYNFYKDYGRSSGFDIRSSSVKYDKNKSVLTKYFVCNRQGFSDVDLSDIVNKGSSKVRSRRTMVGRCGCIAKLIISRNSPTGFIVAKFIEKHNHDLVIKGKQFMKMSRQVSVGHQLLIVDASRCNIGLTTTHNLAKQLSGGFEHIGATNLDFKNFNRDVRCWISARDAQMLVDKLESKKNIFPEFFYKYDTDEEGCLDRLFWTDHVSRRNYLLFGDVISFDSTYRTNK